MNPPNPFGRPQGGAFQAPSNTMKTGLFQKFGQQSSNNQPQTMEVFQPSAFGQPSGLIQPSSHGNTMFGQAPVFGQPSAQQAPAFGQPPVATSSSGFSSGTAPAFGQTSGLNQASVFGQPSAFGQTSGFSRQAPGFGQTQMTSGPTTTLGQSQPPGFSQQAPGFGQTQMTSGPTTTLGQSQPPGFGQTQMTSGPTTTLGQSQPPGFGQTQMTSGPTTTLGQSQPPGFGQSTFGQPAFGQPASVTSVTSGFGIGNSVAQNKPLGPSKFSFKPATEALFKPIFSASPEPTNPQATSMSSSPFGTSGNQTTSSSTTTGFSQVTFSSANSGPTGFSFSLPAAAPSISSQNNPLTTSNNGGPTKNLQFTFSQPAPPSGSSTTKASTAQPSTPSSFSFSIKPPQTQTSLFEGTSLGQRSAFGDNKGQSDEKGSGIEALEETNVFARLGKGTKRKEDPAVSNIGQEKPATVEDVLAEAESTRHPPKRPLMRSHGPPGLFGRALSGLRKEGTNLGRREATKETEREDVQGQDDNMAATPPTAPTTLTKEVLEKAEESAKTSNPELQSFTPVKRGVRRESSESLSGGSTIDCTVLHCRNIPSKLNRKNIIEKHFARFGKVTKVICRPAKNFAFIYFDDHASAAQAKKKGKVLHQHELILLWQRKKQSPGDKESRAAVENEEVGETSKDAQSRSTSSPFRRAQLRAAEGTNNMTFRSSSPAKKSASAKALQFNTEPQKESGTEPQGSERPVPSSLLHLIGQVAETTEDKYRLLEQRDKELRQARPKRTDLNLSKAFVGTCPDMCPEKERYMRETRNQLSIYEVIPSTELVDHTTAIKEYSRSSADKEDPLPNELRPLPVLGMTMDYLVTQIMDLGHDNYRDWYDFVWNRTRGIRKDITQQHLCCPHTVSLIEKCTRFHVHCAHHLCEQHMSSFDPKINNENMTKCLQSLKEMYQDLAMRQIYCSQEAEFRQYGVLLRLNDGDVLREVQQFRDEVRNSSEVKFAVQAFTAVSSNNFVRFFKLVKGASYLASCLLHRYFNQVRAKALHILNIAHTVGPRSTAFPVEDVTRMLMFRSTAEAADFIQQYGLNVNEDMVELSRTAFQDPELPLSQKKSELILAKKTMLIGEVVNGGPLPNPPQHAPICSFDAQNKYRGELTSTEPTTSHFKALTAKLEVKASPGQPESLPQVASLLDTRSDFGLPPAVPDVAVESHYSSSHVVADAPQFFQPIHQPQPVKSPSPPPLPPPPVYSDEEIKAELNGVIEEVIEGALREVADVGASYAKTALAESSVQMESLVAEVLRQMLQDVSSAEIKLEQQRVAEEKRKREEARRRQEHEAFLNQFSASLSTELIQEVVDETIKQTSKSEIQQAVDEKAQRVAKCTEQVCSGLLEETLNADIALIVEDILDVELQRIHKYIKMWRDVVAVRRQLKRQMRGFPAAPCCVDPRFKLKALAPSAPVQPSMADLAHGVVNLGNAGTLALSSTRLLKMRQEAIHQMRVHYFHQLLLDEMVWAPLDLPALVAENIPDPPVRIFWKLALLLPSNHESEASLADGILSDWLEVKLGGEGSEVRKEQPEGTLQTLCVTNTLQEKEQHTHIVHVSVKACRGPLNEDGLSKMEEIGELTGTGALVMLLPTMSFMHPGRDEQDVPLLSALLQLKQLQQASSWHCPLPLVILVPGPDGGADDEQKLGEALMLHTLVQEGLISEFMFFFIPETTSDIQGSKQLSSAMCWLLARAPPSFPLACRSLVELVEASLSREFNSRVHSHHQERAAARLPPQDPAPIIQLYNAVLLHTANTVSSEDLCKISWPPSEFSLPENRHFVPHLGFNSPQHLAWLRKAVLSLQLPQWEQLSSVDSWSELCSSIHHYAAQIPVSCHSQPLLMSRLENLLEKVRLKCHGAKTPRSAVTMTSWDSGDDGVFPAYRSQIPWEDVLVICIDHKLKDWQIPGPPVCKDAVTEDGEILVYFPADALSSFQPPEEWTEATRQTHREKKQQEENGASAAACITPSSQSLRQRLFHSVVETPESFAAPLDITHTPTAQELMAHKLLQSVEHEKAESKRSMEQLQRWLDGDTLDHLSTPLFLPSSTLLSMPTTVTRMTRDGGLTQGSDHRTQRAQRPLRVPASFEWRLKELQRQILASQEEELACRLELSGLLNIVDD